MIVFIKFLINIHDLCVLAKWDISMIVSQIGLIFSYTTLKFEKSV